MKNEKIKKHPMKRFFKAVATVLPNILMFIGIYCLIFLLVFGLGKGIENEATSKTLVTENEYLKSQIEWYQAQLADDLHVTALAITNGDPDE